MPSGRGFESGLDARQAGVKAHDHAVFAYRTEEELVAGLAKFAAEGLAERDLVVFVHSFDSDDDAWRFLRRAVPDVERERDIVVVSLYSQAFEGGREHIDHEHTQQVVESLLRSASERGLSGTRIFVDASRRYLGGGRTDEWFRFENWLGRKLAAGVGLVCAYRRDDIMREDVLPRVLQTHAYRFEA